MSKIIVSAFRATNSLIDNYKQHEELIRFLKISDTPRPVLSIGVGSFKEEGQQVAAQEICIVADFAELDIIDRIELAASLIQEFKQDAVLYISQSNQAYLLTFKEFYVHHTPIGTFTEVSEAEAKASECFTYVNGTYYVCK